MTINIKSLKVGDEMPAFVSPELGVTHFVKYAGASGDFNPLHHDPEFATARGMDGIIGHGMLTAGILGQVIARWAGPINVRRFGARFSKPVLPKDVLTCGAKVAKVYEDKGLPRADLDCTVQNARGDTVLTGSATIGPHQ